VSQRSIFSTKTFPIARAIIFIAKGIYIKAEYIYPIAYKTIQSAILNPQYSVILKPDSVVGNVF